MIAARRRTPSRRKPAFCSSLHLLGVAHDRLGDKAKARDHLARAVERRKPLEHPGLADTEDELKGI